MATVILVMLTLPVVVMSVVTTPMLTLIAERLVITSVNISKPWPSVIETDDSLKHTVVARTGEINSLQIVYIHGQDLHA